MIPIESCQSKPQSSFNIQIAEVRRRGVETLTTGNGSASCGTPSILQYLEEFFWALIAGFTIDAIKQNKHRIYGALLRLIDSYFESMRFEQQLDYAYAMAVENAFRDVVHSIRETL